MSLLQIHDPTAGPRAIGIDLGTTHSVVAYVGALGEPVAIADCDGSPLVPSVVHYAQEGGVVVGARAVDLAQAFPADTIASVKRFMGRSADDPETQRASPYRFATTEGPVVRFLAGGRVVTPVEVSAAILRELKRRAEAELGAVGGAVITVPAYFDDAQRQATKDAARLAGLEVLRLLNEPTAAALAYGLDARTNGTFAVYDLGGGTFDVTILVLDDGVFQVKATGGDTHLGGDDMDRLLAESMLERIGASGSDAGAVRYALDSARRVKHALSEHEEVLLDLAYDGRSVPFAVTRAWFERAIEPLLARADAACRRAMRDAGVTMDDIDGIVLVGGATRVPAVRRRVAETFGREPLDGVDPDLVVAMGAALHADMLSGRSKNDALLIDVLPLSLGIEAMGGVVEKILPRGTPIPCEAAQVFTTYADGQTGFELHVVQGERELVSDVRSLARFTLRGIPPMAAGLARLEVRFRVDADGILHVAARERTTGLEQTVDVQPSHGLDEATIERMLEEAFEAGEHDVEARALAERRVEAERILAATRKAIVEDGDLLEPSERTAIEEAVKNLEQARRGSRHRDIDARIEALERATRAFAGRRMDRAMQKALRGREIDAVELETRNARGIERAHEPT